MRSRNLLSAAVLAALAAAAAPAAQAADDAQSVEALRNTVINLLEGLVEKGVLTREQAQAMVADAQAKADEQARTQAAQRAAQEAAEKDAVRVTYVPEIVREQIRNELRAEMQDDVAKDVVAIAKKEGWGVPGALPEWARTVRLYGDVRARYEVDWFADENLPAIYLDINSVNQGASITSPDAFLNTTEDRRRLVGRLRAGATAQLGGAFALDFRLSSGNARTPVSTNQTLGNYNGRWAVQIDKAALLWHPENTAKSQEFDLRLGRFANPFVSINELLWDNDVTFEGISATYAIDVFDREASKMERGLFLTLGGFPLQELELSSDDKWLYGGQLGMEIPISASARLRVAGGYFHYENITGEMTEIGNDFNLVTAPGFVQKGNTLYDIDVTLDGRVFALAGDYRLANGSLWLDLDLGGTHVMLGGEYVKNVGWDRDEVFARTGGVVEPPRPLIGTGGTIDLYELLQEHTEGYEAGITVGKPSLTAFGDWRASLFYRYVERDAVLDAFTDSDLHLGGTDSKGYQAYFDLGLARGAWLRLRYLSADEIDGIPLGIDVLQLDLNGQF